MTRATSFKEWKARICAAAAESKDGWAVARRDNSALMIPIWSDGNVWARKPPPIRASRLGPSALTAENTTLLRIWASDLVWHPHKPKSALEKLAEAAL